MITWTASDGDGAAPVIGRVRFAPDAHGGDAGRVVSVDGEAAFRRAFALAVSDPGPHQGPLFAHMRGPLSPRSLAHVTHAIGYVAQAYGHRLHWRIDGAPPPRETDADPRMVY